MLFDGWLSETVELQQQAYGLDYERLANDPNFRADYFAFQILAAMDELSEAADEVGWKPWAKTRGWINRDAFIEECVDTLHFIGNLLAAAGVSDKELSDAYHAKMRENQRRQDEGYEQRGMPPDTVS